jgi:uncharacterized membrane protein
MNIYLYLLILTVTNWIILKSFKRKIKTELQKDKRNTKTKSNLIYIIVLPVVSYITYLIFSNRNTQNLNPTDDIKAISESINKTDTIVTDISSLKDIAKQSTYDKPFPLSGD